MVVGHRDDQVEGAAARAHEHRVRRERALRVDAFGACGLDGRGDDLDLLAPEQPALAGMRVQPGHRDARRALPPGGGGMRDAQRAQHGVVGDELDRLAQRDVDRHQHHTQLLVGQHHAHRRQLAAVGCQGLQHLGVARKRHAGGRQRLLVDRRGDQGRSLAGTHPAHRLLDAGRRRRPGTGVDTAPGQRRQAFGQRGRHQHRQASRRHHREIGRRVDHRDHAGASTAQHRRVADDDAVRGLAPAEGRGDDLRPDAGGVAHRDQQRRVHTGLSISMKRCSRPKCAATAAAAAGAP